MNSTRTSTSTSTRAAWEQMDGTQQLALLVSAAWNAKKTDPQRRAAWVATRDDANTVAAEAWIALQELPQYLDTCDSVQVAAYRAAVTAARRIYRDKTGHAWTALDASDDYRTPDTCDRIQATETRAAAEALAKDKLDMDIISGIADGSTFRAIAKAAGVAVSTVMARLRRLQARAQDAAEAVAG